jgi:hypothetical protein
MEDTGGLEEVLVGPVVVDLTDEVVVLAPSRISETNF